MVDKLRDAWGVTVVGIMTDNTEALVKARRIIVAERLDIADFGCFAHWVCDLCTDCTL